MIDSNYVIAANNKIAYTYSAIGTSLFSDTIAVDPWNDVIEFQGHVDFPWSTTYRESLETTYELPRTNFTDFKFYKHKLTNSPVLVTLSKVVDPNGTIVSPV